MGISGIKNKTPLGKASALNNTSSATKTKQAGGDQSSGVKKAPAVSVSGANEITQSMASGSAQRSQRVAEVKSAIDKGEYNLDSAKTAGSIIQDLTDHSFA